MTADLTFDGNIKVSWVATIANTSFPTTAELNAGTALQGDLTPDGLKTPFDTAGVDNSSLASTVTTMQAGRRTPNCSLTYKLFHSDGTSRSAKTTLVYQAEGYLVVRRNKAASTAWADGDIVEVYPSQCGQPSPTDPAPNEVQKATINLFTTGDPVLNAEVGGSSSSSSSS